MEFTKVDDIRSYIESFPPAGKKASLFRIRSLCKALGNPENSYKTIHVAGSKGKGSVSAFLAASLASEGNRTGLYMSPHVLDFRERFTLCSDAKAGADTGTDSSVEISHSVRDAKFSVNRDATVDEKQGLTAGSGLPDISSLPDNIGFPTDSRLHADSGLPTTNTRLPAGIGLPNDSGLPAGSRIPADTRLPDFNGLPADSRLPNDSGLPAGSRIPADTRLPDINGLSADSGLPDAGSKGAGTGREFFSDDVMLSTAKEFYQKINNPTLIDLARVKPSVFEVYTAFAFLLFKNAGCSIAVLETGLGGRLDATNIVNPICSVLTRIEKEHTDVLGSSIKEIAGEKAKIIKDKRPVFIGIQSHREAKAVFLEEAATCGSPAFVLENELKSLDTATSGGKQRTKVVFQDGSVYTLNLSMLGAVQAENAALSLLVLKNLGFLTEETKMTTLEAMERVTLPARMQRIEHRYPLSNATSENGNQNCAPRERNGYAAGRGECVSKRTGVQTYFIDGAHTEKSLRNAIDTMRHIVPDSEQYAVFCCIKGKDYHALCSLIAKYFKTVVVSRPNTYKDADTKEIHRILTEDGLDSHLIEDTASAVEFFERNAPSGAAILVCGSFYLAEKFILCLEGNKCR